jgi:uncharacterized membrane protein (UPF0182 family)
MKKTRNYILLLLVLLVWASLAGGISLYIEGLWFGSLGYWQVFRLTILARSLSFLLGLAVTLPVLWASVWFASRRPRSQGFWFKQEFVEVAQKSARVVLLLVAIGVSILAGLVFQSNWMTLLQFLHKVQAGVTDPLFHRDVGFYFFSLPVFRLAVNYLLLVGFLALLLSAAGYLVHGHLGYMNGFRLTRQGRTHLSVVVAGLLFLIAVRFWLARFDLLYDAKGVVFGASYADVHGWLPVYWLLAFAAALAAISLLLTIPARSVRPAVYCTLGFVAAYLLLNLYPPLLQTFIVNPNEIQKEQPFIRNNIQSTLKAYRLDQVETHDFSTGQPITQKEFTENKPTLRNIRLWDWRPLLDAYGQLQSIRLYYEFEDVDVDRYSINDEYRQVMLSVRELDFARISESAQNWINQHFQYTHGEGLCMSPVNEVTAEGLPEFFIKDIPPRSSVDLQITRPEIYFGEKTTYPVFVRTKLKEFDYPTGDTNAMTTYRADRGLAINSLIRRLIFSWELGTYKILFTGNFTDESRVLLHRQIQDRVRRLAPFLLFDRDPYIVIGDQGRLFWIQDAYTDTDRYPYSEPYPSRNEPRFNYLRNSVKIVTDAYLGDVSFYIADPGDPLIQVYSRIFPGMFHPLEDLPDSLRRHIRYPVDFFDVQRDLFRRYHMTDPTVFYNQEDAWEVPNEIYRGNEQLMESYYIVMSLPEEDHEEFILLVPFTPRNKNNMIAWLAARSDGDAYGKLVLYQFPKQELTYGPMQIEARIDQNPEISQLITLWSQKGSRVIRGNLLVIPIAGSVLYVEPLYLQAEKSEIPELTRVVVVYGSEVALGETLDEALQHAILGGAGQPVPPAPPRASPSQVSQPATQPSAQANLLAQALEHYQAAQQYLREGNWAAYGEEQKKLGDILHQLAGQPQRPQ